MKRTRPRRPGLGLLEAIIAVGIFVGAMALIGQLLDVGLRQADLDRVQTIAHLRCESKMEEIVAGIVTLDESLPKEPLEDREDPHWRWHVVYEPTSVEGLLRVVCVVEYIEDPEAAESVEASVRESLTRLVVDPALRAVEHREEDRLEGEITLPEMLGVTRETRR